MNDQAIQPQPGTYLLIMQAKRRRQVEVGRLGRMQIEPGYYLYVGSAFGPGGVKARVSHHMKITARPRWHIDYLRQVCPLKMVWCSYRDVRQEHGWIDLLESMPTLSIPMVGFGASDHPGKSHLFYCETKPSRRIFSQWAGKQKGEHIAPLFEVSIET